MLSDGLFDEKKPDMSEVQQSDFLRLCLSVCCAEGDLDATELLSPARSSSARWEWV